jgi:hypothetical protein
MVLNEQASAKWKPILEHEDLPQIADNYRKGVTAVLLENQERMMREQAAQRNGSGLFLTEDVGGAPMGSGMDQSNFAAGGDGLNSLAPAGAVTAGAVQYVDPVLISLVRRTMPKLLAYDVCGVQPLTGPTGLIFAMRSQYGSPGQLPAEGATVPNEAFFGEANTAYTTNATGGQHVDLKDSAAVTAYAGGGADPIDVFFTPGGYGHGFGTGTSTGENMGRGVAGVGAIPEMSFSIEKMSVTAQTRKLRGQYTLEMAQDLKATHGLNAESELSNILSNEILAEINRQVIRTIYTVAKPGALNTTTQHEFDLLVDSNGRWSVEKFKGLMFQMEVEANQIARQTRRGKGNVIICSADVASAFQMAGVLDYSSNLKVSMKTDETDNLFAGVLNGQFKVYIDPYLPVNASKAMVVVGYKGTSPYDSGVFYCPYQPLQMLRAQDPATFTPIIGFMSRDAMVANPFSQIDASGYPVRVTGNGIDSQPNLNVYYRKLKVLNLT